MQDCAFYPWYSFLLATMSEGKWSVRPSCYLSVNTEYIQCMAISGFQGCPLTREHKCGNIMRILQSYKEKLPYGRHTKAVQLEPYKSSRCMYAEPYKSSRCMYAEPYESSRCMYAEPYESSRCMYAEPYERCTKAVHPAIQSNTLYVRKIFSRKSMWSFDWHYFLVIYFLASYPKTPKQKNICYIF